MKHEVTYCDDCGEPVYQTGGDPQNPRQQEGTLRPYHTFNHVP